ncbi:MAG: ATP-binding cassette domain-containing protein [Propionibacteriaceae bacterium]|nr:ATP-binding cassette domain-containing protein [Propionibacteriaceae bacterium]
MLRCERIRFGYDPGRPVLADFSLTLPGAGLVVLTGPSGCGKTTLLRLLAGLAEPQAGEITGLQARRGTRVVQEDRLLPWESALANAVTGTGSRARAPEYLSRLGLDGDQHRLPAELSGGMRRRVAIARALAADHDLLLLDEPFTGLDEPAWRRAATLIAEVSAGRLVVLVTHLHAQAEALDVDGSGTVLRPFS